MQVKRLQKYSGFLRYPSRTAAIFEKENELLWGSQILKSDPLPNKFLKAYDFLADSCKFT